MLRKRWTWLIAVGVLLGVVAVTGGRLAASASVAFQGPGGPGDLLVVGPGRRSFAPERVLVRLRPGLAPAAMQPSGREAGGLERQANQGGRTSWQVLKAEPLLPVLTGHIGVAGEGVRADDGLDRIYRVELSPGGDVMAAVAALSVDPGVEWAEPDYVAHGISDFRSKISLAYPPGQADLQTPALRAGASVANRQSHIPNDPLFTQQWGLAKIEAGSAWEVVTGSQAVAIAVVDSGIELGHPDLAGKLWVNPGEIAGNGLDDDNDGYADDVNGWDFVGNDNEPEDEYGHGTQAAGIIAAATDNGVGVAGVCWGCRLMAVRVMGTSGVANYSDVAAGVVYAARKGAKVINLSLGGYSDSRVLREAIRVAVEKYGVVVVGGAGNDNSQRLFYPAAYPEVVAVAGVTADDTKASFSNYGSWVDVSAPAEGITTTLLGGDWGAVEGTSCGASMVSGVAGLVRSQRPEWREALVRAQVLHTADRIEAQDIGDSGLGAGRVNAGVAVRQAPHPILELVSAAVDGEIQGRPVAGESARLEIGLSNAWLDAISTTGVLSTTDPYVTVGQGEASFGDIAAGEVRVSHPNYSFTVASEAGQNYAIRFTLTVTAIPAPGQAGEGVGGVYTATLPLTVTTSSGEVGVCGLIVQDEEWTSDKVYVATCDVQVAPGYTLTIRPGVEARFGSGVGLKVAGTLIADGTPGQPIRLRGQDVSAWEGITFYDLSADARATAEYEYMAGSILRYVEMENVSGGIECHDATPYLSQLRLSSGGLRCTPGTLWVGTLAVPGMALVLDSEIAGGVVVTGAAQVWRSRVANGRLSVSGQASVLSSTLWGGAYLGDRSLVQATSSDDHLGLGNGGSAVGNIVTGSLGLGDSAVVLSNTVVGWWGISVGDLAEVRGNNVQGANEWGISGGAVVTVSGNRLVGNMGGIRVNGGWVQGNLIANSREVGLQVGPAVVVSNTLVGNLGDALGASGTAMVSGNNLEGNLGAYDLVNQTASSIGASGNWWGTLDEGVIGTRVYDMWDDVNLGQVAYLPVLSGPVQTAPAYVRAVTLTPESLVGIETVTFEVEFSRPMDEDSRPEMAFHASESWGHYTSTSGLPHDYVCAIAIDADGAKWFGTFGGGVARFDGTSWTVYDTSNSGLPHDYVYAIAIDADGAKWFVTGQGYWDRSGVARFDGTNWTVYDTSNSGLPEYANVSTIAIDADGVKWFGTEGGVVRFDGTSWTVYNASNSGLPDDRVLEIAIDHDGAKWFITGEDGVVRFDGTSWTVYDSSNSPLSEYISVSTIAIDADGAKWFGAGDGVVRFNGMNWKVYNDSNSGLLYHYVNAIAIDADGAKWFVTGGGGVVRFDGTSWTVYNTSNSGLPDDYVHAIAIDADGAKWFGLGWDPMYGDGVGVLYKVPEYAIGDNAEWLSPTRWQASYDFSVLITRGVYSLVVSGARGADGIEIAPSSAYTFSVDYAGSINDATPPPTPAVWVDMCRNSTTEAAATWSAYDPDSQITLYRYALGSTPGGANVLNWTSVEVTGVVRSGLSLLVGQPYYFSVKARNESGLWSESASGRFIAGVPCSRVYLPLAVRE